MRLKETLLFALTLVLCSSCASYKAARQPALSYDLEAQGNKVEEQGIVCMVKPIHLKSELETYFDDDLLQYGVLPMQIYLSNKEHGRNVVFSTDGINLIEPSSTRCPVMSCDQVLEKAKKSYWRTAGWGAAFGIFGIIPSAINVSNTNKKIQADYESRAIKGGNLIPDGVTEGLVFFSVPPDISSLNGYTVSIILKDPQEGQDIDIKYGLSGTVVPRKTEKETKQEESQKYAH
jgi:hypothetical protein